MQSIEGADESYFSVHYLYTPKHSLETCYVDGDEICYSPRDSKFYDFLFTTGTNY